MKYVLFFLLCVRAASGLAQSMTGTVTDAQTGEPLPFVSVYLSNTTHATNTDTTGSYKLTGMGPGRYTFAVRVVGYTPYYQSVTLQAGIETRINVKLKSEDRALTEVKVVAKRDKAWEKLYQMFSNEFLGSTASARLCKIVNPWVIELEEKDKVLTARASELIEIENRYLGYKVVYDLRSFRFDGQQTFYSGLSSFQPLVATGSAEAAQWQAHRERVFIGSEIHLFKSLAEGKAPGYEAYLDKPGSDPSQRSRFFYQDQVKRLTKFELDSMVRPVQGNFQIRLPRRFELHSPGSEGAFSIYRDKPSPVAWIETSSKPLIFTKDGLLLNPQEWTVAGYLANLRMAETLPIDFQATPPTPAPKRSGDDWQEYPLVSTDQPYYRPGQTISLAGQMTYSNPAFRDSLSRLLRVELWSPNQQPVYSAKWIIQEGVFQGQILLSDTLSPGMYLLRTYTQWMRNFTDSAATLQWIPLLGFSEKPVVPTAAADSLLTLHVSQQDSLYHWSLQASPDAPLAYASLSILDEESTPWVAPPPLPLPERRSRDFPRDIPYPMERSIRLRGKVTGRNDKGIVDAKVLLLVPRLRLSFTGLTDQNGDFSFVDLPIQEKQDVVIQALNGRGKSTGTVTLYPETASLPAPVLLPPLFPTEPTPGPLVIVYDTNFTAKAIQLNEIAVKAPKTPPPPRTYRQPDYVVQGKDLQSGLGSNFLVALQGRVPGLDIREVRDADGFSKLVVYMRGSSSAGFSSSARNPPLILVDGVPFEDINQIAAISPSSVERVEVVTRAEPMLGVRGYSGVISVFTRQGSRPELGSLVEDRPTFSWQGYTLPGNQPTASRVWLPNLVINPLGVTEGKLPRLPAGQYRIVVEGFTHRGQTVKTSVRLLME